MSQSAAHARNRPDGSFAGRTLNAMCALHPCLIEARVGNALSRNVPKQLTAIKAPGAQFALAVGNRPFAQWTFGEASHGQPMTPAAPFRVASLSKPVAALVTLRLAEAGILDLDQPLDPFLSDIEGLQSAVTARLLLSHRAGLRDCVAPHLLPGSGATLADVLSGRLGEPYTPRFSAPAGGPTRYSGAGYMLLQAALERLTGCCFADLTRDLVFVPLAMRNSGFEVPAAREFGLEHDAEGRALPIEWTPCLASSGLWTTAGDLVRLGREVLRSARRAGGLISPHTARQMIDAPGGETPFGLGFHVLHEAPTRSVSHGAVRPGLRGMLLLLPEAEIAFAAIVNGAQGSDIIRPLRGLVTDLGARSKRQGPPT